MSLIFQETLENKPYLILNISSDPLIRYAWSRLARASSSSRWRRSFSWRRRSFSWRSRSTWARSCCNSSRTERGTDTGSNTLMDAIAASSLHIRLDCYSASPRRKRQGGAIQILTGGYSYRSNVTATWDRPGSQDQSTPPTLGSFEGRAGPTASVLLPSAVLARRGGVVDEDPEGHDRRSGERIPSHGRRGQYLLAPTVRHRRQRQGVAVAHSGGGTEMRIGLPPKIWSSHNANRTTGR